VVFLFDESGPAQPGIVVWYSRTNHYGFPVKTTLEISDSLIEQARVVQRRDRISLKALVEEGLRLAVAKRVTPSEYRFEPVFGGSGWLTEEAEKAGGLSGVLREINER